MSILAGRYNVLYVRGINGGDIAPHDMPPPSPRHQLEAEDVWTIESELLDGEVFRLAVEDRNTITIIS